MPHGAIYIVPVRLENCVVPAYEASGIRFDQYQRIDCFEKNYFELVRFLENRTIKEIEQKEGELSPENSDELLDSFESGRDVVLSKDIDLSAGTKRSRRRILIEDTHDGYQFVVRDVQNMNIRAKSDPVTVSIPYSYSNVLIFENCKDLVIRNLRFGHAVERGTCVGGVIVLRGCEEVHFSHCDFYGCGSQAIEMERCKRISFDSCIVRECTYGIGTIRRSNEVIFEKTRFIDNSEFYGIYLDMCNDIAFENCDFVRNSIKEELIVPSNCSRIIVSE